MCTARRQRTWCGPRDVVRRRGVWIPSAFPARVRDKTVGHEARAASLTSCFSHVGESGLRIHAVRPPRVRAVVYLIFYIQYALYAHHVRLHVLFIHPCGPIDTASVLDERRKSVFQASPYDRPAVSGRELMIFFFFQFYNGSRRYLNTALASDFKHYTRVGMVIMYTTVLYDVRHEHGLHGGGGSLQCVVTAVAATRRYTVKIRRYV